MKEETSILLESNEVVSRRISSKDIDEVTRKMGLSKDYPEPDRPQVFSTSCFPREFRKEASVYIGRQGPHGNNFVINVHGNRSEVVVKYEQNTIQKLRTDPEFREFFTSELKGRHLVCHCKPLLCHGDVILNLLQLIALNDPSLRPAPPRENTPPKV